jgi:hypothetical protein
MLDELRHDLRLLVDDPMSTVLDDLPRWTNWLTLLSGAMLGCWAPVPAGCSGENAGCTENPLALGGARSRKIIGLRSPARGAA